MGLLWHMAERESVRRFARRWIPPAIRESVNRIAGYAITYRGPYPDWSAAAAAAAGYGDAALVARLVEAARTARARPGSWEQDGVVRDAVPPDFPLLYALLRAAAAPAGRRLTVLDFGGGLGTSYRQCRPYLPTGLPLHWRVVEQPTLAAAGSEFASEELRFFDDLEQALAHGQPDVALLSSVLQYLPEPYRLLERIAAAGVRNVVIDRHPFSLQEELIVVQVVPRSLYAASYPSWLFNRTRFLSSVTRTFDVVAQWDGKDPAIRGPRGIGATFQGMLLQRRT